MVSTQGDNQYGSHKYRTVSGTHLLYDSASTFEWSPLCDCSSLLMEAG